MAPGTVRPSVDRSGVIGLAVFSLFGVLMDGPLVLHEPSPHIVAAAVVCAWETGVTSRCRGGTHRVPG